MLKAIQMAFQDLYIKPLGQTSMLEKLAHHDQVPIGATNLSPYMLTPLLGVGIQYYIKVIIHSNNKLKGYMNNTSFREYLLTEQITIDYNYLTTAIVCKVSIIEQVTANQDTLLLH
jgi:hypothetical protein